MRARETSSEIRLAIYAILKKTDSAYFEFAFAGEAQFFHDARGSRVPVPSNRYDAVQALAFKCVPKRYF